MTTIYISGGIAGVSNYKVLFRDAQMLLEELGYEVVNPCDLGTIGADTVSPWARNMRADIQAMMECDGVAVLSGWQNSKGSCVEAELAMKLEMPVMSLSDWVRVAEGKFV